MKSLLTLKALLGLLSMIAISPVVFAGMTQTRFLDNPRSQHNPVEFPAADHPISSIPLAGSCNVRFSSCPLSD
jgi:hypothetical protein